MLGDSLAHSKLYFQLLHLLRIIPLWIRETKYDLEKLRDECNTTISTPIAESEHQPFLRSVVMVRWNWDQLMSRFRALESELCRRIDAKTDEITGLRDGVSKISLLHFPKLTSYFVAFQRKQPPRSAQSDVDESIYHHLHNRDHRLPALELCHSKLNIPRITREYCIPSKHSLQAIFSMDLMHEAKLASLKRPYTIIMAVVSVFTYMIVLGCILFLNRRKAIPYIAAFFRSLIPACLAQAEDRPDVITDTDWEKHGQCGPWSGFLSGPGPKPRRRWKWKGKGDVTDVEASKPEGDANV